jgi:sugar phosphate isomerase/epimerase
MVAYGFVEGGLAADLAIARRLGAEVVEILPDWRSLPDPRACRTEVNDAGLRVHSAHGCWGGQSIRAARVDLGDTGEVRHRASVEDLSQCVDWLAAAGGSCLVVHPGGLSDPDRLDARRDALVRGLLSLADHAKGTGVVLCVENMPPGVWPGSRMADLAAVVRGLARPEVAPALDTGHANITGTARSETNAAGDLLRTTHVHDNDGKTDSHLAPGLGTIDWEDWAESLDEVGYDGPIMLECIRHFRKSPEMIGDRLRVILDRLTTIRPLRRLPR